MPGSCSREKKFNRISPSRWNWWRKREPINNESQISNLKSQMEDESETPTMSQKLKIGIVGIGRLGNLYARYFLGRISNATLTAVSDVLEDVAESFAAEHNVPRWY